MTQSQQLSQEQIAQWIQSMETALNSPYVPENEKQRIRQELARVKAGDYANVSQSGLQQSNTSSLSTGTNPAVLPSSVAVSTAVPTQAATPAAAATLSPNTTSGRSSSTMTLSQNGLPVSTGVKFDLTREEFVMIQNFAERKPDAGDKKGYRLRVVDASGNLSQRYYAIDKENNTIYRKGDPKKTPIYFTDLHLQLTEEDYENYLIALKKDGRKFNAPSDDEIAEKEANKPWLVRSADWLDKNLFGSIASFFGTGLFSILGSGIKMVGGVLTGLMRTIGYALNGQWSEAGSAALIWGKDAAITALIAWGSSALYKYFTKEETTTTTSSSSENASSSTSSGTTTTVNSITVSTSAGGALNTTNAAELMDRLQQNSVQTNKALQALTKERT